MITHQDLLDAGYKYKTFPSNDYESDEIQHLYTKVFENDSSFPLDISVIEWSQSNFPKSPNQCSAMIFGNDERHWQFEFILNSNFTVQSMENEFHKFYQLILSNFS